VGAKLAERRAEIKYKTLLIRRNLKIILEEGLCEFFKFNICCYNILKIKNILIIRINLSFSKKPRKVFLCLN